MCTQKAPPQALSSRPRKKKTTRSKGCRPGFSPPRHSRRQRQRCLPQNSRKHKHKLKGHKDAQVANSCTALGYLIPKQRPSATLLLMQPSEPRAASLTTSNSRRRRMKHQLQQHPQQLARNSSKNKKARQRQDGRVWCSKARLKLPLLLSRFWSPFQMLILIRS